MKIISKSVNDTLKIGRVIAKHLRAGDILCLFGELGSGKTVLTKGIAQGLGIAKEQVVSPSFILIREYKGRLPLYHLDLYRLQGARDILGLGYQDYIYNQGVSVIEWADRLKSLMPKEFLKIELYIRGSSQRRLEFKAAGSRYRKLLKKINVPKSE